MVDKISVCIKDHGWFTLLIILSYPGGRGKGPGVLFHSSVFSHYPGGKGIYRGILSHSSVSSHYSWIQGARTYTGDPHWPWRSILHHPLSKWFIYDILLAYSIFLLNCHFIPFYYLQIHNISRFIASGKILLECEQLTWSQKMRLTKLIGQM